METKSPIQEFYKNQTILIFGVSGFIGKVLLEKILFSCSDVKTIYIVLRSKRGENAEKRLKKMLEMMCFDRLKKNFPNFALKISVIEGNCLEESCGLSIQDQVVLEQEVTVCFNFVADVRLAQSLKNAIDCNIRSTLNIFQLVKRMSKLKAFVHVSTAYSNANRRNIEEIFYPPAFEADALLNMSDWLNEEQLEAIASTILQNWPNSYTFCKCVCEDYIRREGTGIPWAICRPAVVVYSSEEPLPGWVDNLNGIVGPQMGVFSGSIKVFYCSQDTPLHCVPCDYLANNLLAIAWDLGNQPNWATGELPIYNVVGSKNNYITSAYHALFPKKVLWDIPLYGSMAYPTYIITKNKLVYTVYKFIFHTLFAYLVDFFLICCRKKATTVKQYRMINKMLDSTNFFTSTFINFSYNNVEKLWQKLDDKDKKLFKFNTSDFDWDASSRNNLLYGREYLFNESIDDIPKARRKMALLFFVNYGVKIFVVWMLYEKFLKTLFF